MAFSVFDQALVLPKRRIGGSRKGVPKLFPGQAERPLSARRLAIGVTQVDLAELAGVGRDAVWKVEGGVSVRASTRRKVLMALRKAERAAA